MFKLTVAAEEIEKLPMGSFPGEIHVISRPGIDYLKAIAYLKSQTVIGFDTETRPVFSPDAPHNKVALLQLSGPDHAYLFRINKMGLRRRICSILANPCILKVGAASHDDVRGLQRHVPFHEKGFVDLQKIAWEWGIRDKSVKKLAANIMGIRISKTQQLSNWEADELSESQRKYAATDAWVCREMYMILHDSDKNPLSEEDRVPPEQRKKPEEERRAERAAKQAAALAADAPVKPKKRHRKRKKKPSNDQTVSEKGA